MKGYIILSPIKNEELNLEKLYSSILRQTIRPKKWLIVNDGSTDNSLKLIRKFSRLNPWVEFITLKNEKRNVGPAWLHLFQ